MAADDTYRLAPVRAGRARDEAVSRGELADAVGAVREAERDISRAAQRVAEARAAVERAVAGNAATALDGERRDRFAARLRRELEGAEAEHARLALVQREREGVVDTARGSLAAAKARREVIERHFARWRDERRKLADRRAD